jgi:hypothetical protein
MPSALGKSAGGKTVSYEETEVPVAKSQDGIRKMVYAHKGTGISFMSHPPREGFEALVMMQDQSYHIRVMATCKQRSNREQEERRVWRVLYWHLKAMFEAADSGVIAIEDIIMPYVVTPDGRTIAEHIAPKLAEMQKLTHEKLLGAATGEYLR